MPSQATTRSTETTRERLAQFSHEVQNYVQETALVCDDLASYFIREAAILENLRSIGDTPKFVGPAPEYYWFGRARIYMNELLLPRDPYEYSLHYDLVAIANRFHDRLKLLNPDLEKFDQIAASQTANEFLGDLYLDNILKKIQKLEAERDLAVELWGRRHTTDDANITIPVRGADEPANKDVETAPIVELQSGVTIWRGTRYPDQDTADAIKAMLDAKGQPIGLGEYLRKPAVWLRKLQKEFAELASIVEPCGKKGYRITIFDPPSDDI